MGRGRPHKCPYCGSTKTASKGFRYNRAGTVKLRRCTACKRRWTAGVAAAGQKVVSAKPAKETGHERVEVFESRSGRLTGNATASPGAEGSSCQMNRESQSSVSETGHTAPMTKRYRLSNGDARRYSSRHMKLDSLKQFVTFRNNLIAEKARLEKRLKDITTALGESTPSFTPKAIAVAAPKPARRSRGRRGKKTRTMSDEARAKISAAQTRRWAERKGKKRGG